MILYTASVESKSIADQCVLWADEYLSKNARFLMMAVNMVCQDDSLSLEWVETCADGRSRVLHDIHQIHVARVRLQSEFPQDVKLIRSLMVKMPGQTQQQYEEVLQPWRRLCNEERSIGEAIRTGAQLKGPIKALEEALVGVACKESLWGDCTGNAKSQLARARLLERGCAILRVGEDVMTKMLLADEVKAIEDEIRHKTTTISVDLWDLYEGNQDVKIPVGLLFAGSPYVNMMSAVKEIPSVQTMCAEAKGILGYDILELCLTGPGEKLKEPQLGQLAQFIAGLAGIQKLLLDREEAATSFQACAGIGVGEYVALCVAEVFTFEDALRLVKLRGEAMQKASQIVKQAVLNVTGLEKAKLEQLCEKSVSRVGGICQITVDHSPKAFTCAGEFAAVDALRKAALESGALHAILREDCASNTELMGPARDELDEALDKTLPRMRPPQHIVFSSITAQPLKVGTDPKEIIKLLKQQLTRPVQWESLIRNMIEDGITDFYAVGKSQLKPMLSEIDPQLSRKRCAV